MPESLRQLFFPTAYREFPHQRLLLNILRTIHILTFSVLVGGIYFKQPEQFLFFWAIAAILSGVMMFAIDCYNSCMVLFELRGIVVQLKILLLLLSLYVNDGLQLTLIFSVLIISSFSSHTSRRIRHINIMSDSFQQQYGYQPKTRNTKTIKELT